MGFGSLELLTSDVIWQLIMMVEISESANVGTELGAMGSLLLGQRDRHSFDRQKASDLDSMLEGTSGCTIGNH